MNEYRDSLLFTKGGEHAATTRTAPDGRKEALPPLEPDDRHFPTSQQLARAIHELHLRVKALEARS